MKMITIHFDNHQPVKIKPRWIGENLAVHREIIIRLDCGGIIGQNPNKDDVFTWTVTHLNTGFRAGIFNSLSAAISAAKMADFYFAGISTKDEATSNYDLCNNWRNTVNQFNGIVK